MSGNERSPSGPAPGRRFSNPQVNLYTNDIEASVRFYRDVLGFAENFRVPKDGVPAHVELSLETFKLGLATFAALEHDHGMHTGQGPPRVEVVLFTDDPDGAHGWATSKGTPSLVAPHDFGGYVRSARVADPDGNPVVFTTKLPLKTTTNPTIRPTFKGQLYSIYTSRIEGALRFYRDTLGFTESFRVPKGGSPDHVEMKLDSVYLAVSTLDALKRDHGLSGGGGPPRGEVVLWAEDVDSAYSWMIGKGAPSLSPPHNFAGVLRAGWVADPDGNPVQIVTRKSHK
jgi:catechol 2,3-dioxygenase-like lactoylglutathione lyase family enzyme